MEMMSSSWRDLTVEMRIACEQKNTAGTSMADMAADATPSWTKKWENYRTPPVGNSGTARKTKDSGRKETVAVPGLQRIQEPHRVFLTGDDVFAQVRFPN